MKAVELERDACYPRILIDKSVLEHFDSVPHWIYRSRDDRPSFDYIRCMGDLASYNPSTMAAEVENLLQIVEKVATTRSIEKLAARDRWMKEYLEYQTRAQEQSE